MASNICTITGFVCLIVNWAFGGTVMFENSRLFGV